MLINWFRDQDHLVYINGETQLAQLEKTLRFPAFRRRQRPCGTTPTPRATPSRGPSAPVAACSCRI